MADGGDGPRGRIASRSSREETAALVAALSRYIAKMRGESKDDPAAGIWADFATANFAAAIEFAKGDVINERGRHYG